MQRFYFPDLESLDESIIIKNPDILHQLHKVLRVKNWDKVIFFNGEENIDYIFEVKEVLKREVYFEKTWEENKESEIDFDLNIFWAFPNKLEKLEYTIQKGVEVWVTWFYFFRSSRSQKLNLSDNKIERLKKIMLEAVEQSWRNRVPELIIEDNLHVEDFKENENLIFHTDAQQAKKLKDLDLDYNKWINIFVGPEWGFTDDEIEVFEKFWCKKICLWNRILRTETVWVVASFFLINNQ